MSAASTVIVRTGQWTDYKYGAVLGKKVTLTSRDAGFLIAFIALFDALVGTMIWNVLTYFLYKWRTNPRKAHDGLYHQSQALLRNSNEPLSFLRHISLSGWAWRKLAPRVLFRTLPLALLALSVSISSSAAGIFSSQIATGDRDVLLVDTTCGTLHTWTADLSLQFARQSELSFSYANTCYVNPFLNQSRLAVGSPASDATCGLYTRMALGFKTKIGNECPFEDPTVCSVPDSEIVQLDTGLLNSDHDLGINQPAENQVSFRRVETCSPVTSQGFSTDVFAPCYESAYNCSTYNYGTSLYISHNTTTFSYQQTAFDAADVAYSISTISTVAGKINMSTTDTPDLVPLFAPVPRLTTDSSLPLTLTFLANREQYVGGPVRDPWFEAIISEETEDYGLPVYLSTIPGRVLACIEQAQICNPTNNQCTDLNSWWYKYANNASAFTELGMNTVQQKTALYIANAISNSSVWALFLSLGPNLLDAQLQLSSLGSPENIFGNQLPANQWQIEVASWMATSNAMLQRLVVDRITGGPLAEVLRANMTFYPDDDDIETSLCKSQRIRSTAYQSFSVLGLTLNFAIGGIVAMITLVLSCLKPAVQQHRSRPNRLWISSSLLQLQRMAYEELGAGEWEGNEDNYPVTKGRQLFRMPLVGPRMQDATSSRAILLEPQPGKTPPHADEFEDLGVENPFGDPAA